MVFRFFSLSLSLMHIIFLPCFAESFPKNLTVTFEESPPYEYSVINGVDGYNIRKIQAISKELGIELKFVVAPMARGLNMTKIGQVDLILSLYKTKERSKYLSYIDFPLSLNQDSIFSHRSHTPVIIDRYEKILPYSVGIVADNSYGEKFDNYPGIKKDSAGYHSDSIYRLSKGRIPYIVMDVQSFYYYLSELKYRKRDYILHPLKVNQQNLHMAFSKTNPALKSLHRAFSEKMKKFENYQDATTLPPACKRIDPKCGPQSN